jgi:hypothetical protein
MPPEVPDRRAGGELVERPVVSEAADLATERRVERAVGGPGGREGPLDRGEQKRAVRRRPSGGRVQPAELGPGPEAAEGRLAHRAKAAARSVSGGKPVDIDIQDEIGQAAALRGHIRLMLESLTEVLSAPG